MTKLFLIQNVQVLLTRELKSSTELKNLKILSLGEWCITPGLNELASILGHSPNLDMVCINSHKCLHSV